MRPPDPGASELEAGPPLDPGSASPESVRAQRLLAAIVESSNDAILSKDLNGIITSWNAGAQRMYGYAPEEVIGRPVSILVPPDHENDVPMLMERLRRGERIRHYETARRTRDGRTLNVSLSVSPVRDEQGRIVGASAIARDITARVKEASRWRLLSQVGQTLSNVLDGEQLLRELARLLVPQLADYCITYLLEGDRIRRVGAAHADPEGETLVRRLVDLAPPTLQDAAGAGSVIRTGEPVVTARIPPEMLREVGGGGEYLELLRRLNPISSIVLPLRARGRTVGAVALATTTHSNRYYDDNDLVLGRELAERAALALDNARLYGAVRKELDQRQQVERALRRRYEQLRLLYELTAAVDRAGEADEIYARALDGLRAGLGVRRASVLLFDSGGSMQFKAWRGLSDEYRNTVEGHSPWTIDVRDPAPVVIPDARQGDQLAPGVREAVLREGIRALAFIPLLVGGRLVGKFMLYFDSPRSLAPEELELAQAIASTVAFGIARATDERNVREAKEAAERASEAKSQFLGVMSHELRTPLNAVVGYAELLLLETKGPLNADQRQQLERVLISARHQLELVEELLTYTRLEAGREEPRWLETDARRVVGDVAELVRPEAEGKGLRLRVDLPSTPLKVLTDPAKLRQILLNLAGNAARYTDSGEVAIRAWMANHHLLVNVADTGPGIPEDRLEYIFQPFSRVDESHTRITMGTGLGLAISRRLAELLGAEIQVRSEVGRGSNFTVRLPRHPLPQRTAESSA